MTYPFAGGFGNSAAYVSGIPWMTSSTITTLTTYSPPAITAYVAIRNDGPDTLRIGATDSITGSTGKYITLPAGSSFDMPLRFRDLKLAPNGIGLTCNVQVALGLSTVPVDQAPTYALTWMED